MTVGANSCKTRKWWDRTKKNMADDSGIAYVRFRF